MTLRAHRNGVSLAPPPSPALARALGLELVDPPDTATPELDITLWPSAQTTLSALCAADSPACTRVLADLTGLRRDTVSGALLKLVESGLARVVSQRVANGPRGTVGQTWSVTDAGRAWVPKATREITEVEILAAMARIHKSRPRDGRIWWRGGMIQRLDTPATANSVCKTLLDGHEPTDGFRKSVAARLADMARAGTLISCTVPRGKSPMTAFWIASNPAHRTCDT